MSAPRTRPSANLIRRAHAAPGSGEEQASCFFAPWLRFTQVNPVLRTSTSYSNPICLTHASASFATMQFPPSTLLPTCLDFLHLLEPVCKYSNLLPYGSYLICKGFAMVHRSDWTEDEKAELCKLASRLGKKWLNISKQMMKRSEDSCRNMWNRMHQIDQIAPRHNNRKCREQRELWTDEEDTLIRQIKDTLHGKISWKEVSKQFPKRTPHSTRGRWRRLCLHNREPAQDAESGDLQDTQALHMNDVELVEMLINEF